MHSKDGTPKSARRGRPTGDHEAKRQELLRATSAVIAQEGYAKASMRKIAKHAGCTTGVVTHYFSNKEELVVALLEHAFDRFDVMLKGIEESGDIKRLSEEWMKLTSRKNAFWPVTSELLALGRNDPVFADIIARRYANFRRKYVSILKAAQKRGEVRDDISADLLTDYLVAIGDGWMLMNPIEPKRFTPARMRKLLDSLMALIAPPSGS
ncbi:MAG: TetR/AcrR family transcriptional regulator [Alcanivorax sp.]|jgi:AcrR family transcriptional regulator|nr:TetR/AcrR family transcriptional regulator [Alcanivorax sp.]|tara:strand:+ start:814 stop:1443 length:630 start_codon:yes stop_codon:yes gene_type:complete